MLQLTPMQTIKKLQSTFLFLLIAITTGCTTTIPHSSLPYPLTNKNFGDTVKVVTIPLPVIASSPNEGITSGALTSFLLHDKNDNISTLLAPQINYNENFGVTTTLYGAFYPSSDRYYEINLSKSTIINEDYEFKLRDKTFLDKKLETNLFLFSLRDGSSRFFGFNAKTPSQQESNYTDHETGFNTSVGYDIGHHLQFIIGERLRHVTIEPGAVKSLRFIRDRFKNENIPGVNGFTAHAQRILLVYSTLDSTTMPTFGGYAKATIENSSRFLGGAANYNHYEGEAKGFIPFDEARYVTVFRLVYNQTLGSDVPFLEQSILGGENTLRGYGRNRFVDNSYFLVNLEQRIRLFRWDVFDVKADWELAPFFDIGAVMERLDRSNGRQFEFNPGLGIRAVVRPNIVGRVDIGLGVDGPALFVGLGYPF